MKASAPGAEKESAAWPVPCTFSKTEPVIDERLQMDPTKAVWLVSAPLDGAVLTQSGTARNERPNVNGFSLSAVLSQLDPANAL